MSETPEQKSKRMGVPLIGGGYSTVLPNGIVGICRACGRSVYAVESYYCPQFSCPLQMKAC